MRKLFCTIVVAAGLCLGACGDFEASNNGSLDGFWQMTSIDTLLTGRSGDMTANMIFWSVQGGLVELSDHRDGELIDERYPSILYRFERVADTLVLLGEPKPRVSNRVKGDSDVASHIQCGFYGLNDVGDRLRILRLEEHKMVLQSEYFRMYFRKF